MRAVFVVAACAAFHVVILQTAQHVIAFVAAAFDALVLAVARTIVAEITGDEDRACYINDHMYLQNFVMTFDECQVYLNDNIY